MADFGTVGIILLIINLIVTYQGLKSHDYLDKYSFQIDKILINKEYKRLVTSGFLHVSWMHFIFNMMTLYFFSYHVEAKLGVVNYLVIYFSSLVGGNLLSLFIHRNHGDYSAVGASGAISGLVFASIALFPGMKLGFFMLPISLPAWLYGILYVLYSIYGIRSQRDNIGHDAHLGGGVAGLIGAILMDTSTLSRNLLPILLILIPSSVFLYLIITRPGFLLVDNLFQKRHSHNDIDEKYNEVKNQRERELNRILDKISAQGIDNLTKREKERLEELSGRKRQREK